VEILDRLHPLLVTGALTTARLEISVDADESAMNQRIVEIGLAQRKGDSGIEVLCHVLALHAISIRKILYGIALRVIRNLTYVMVGVNRNYDG
jgi:hypothetical protein